jgi:hypothetical protein
MPKDKSMTWLSRTRSRHLGVVVAIAVASTGAGVVATGALAYRGHAGHVHGSVTSTSSDLSILSEKAPTSARAREASMGGRRMPTGARFGAALGQQEIYAWRPTATEAPHPTAVGKLPTDVICMIDRMQGTGPGGGPAGAASLCGDAAVVEAEGIVAVSTSPNAPPRVAVLVPNGVPSVAFVNRDGGAQRSAVTNNVAAEEGNANLVSVEYTLPGGAVHTTTIEGGGATG